MNKRRSRTDNGRSPTYSVQGYALAAEPLTGGLYLVATPIGHLGDVTLRALATLAAADLVVCEDTRVTRKLLDRFHIQASLLSYNDHNAPTVRPKILERLAAGEAIALVSDAGTPLVSDPGYKLVHAALDAGYAVNAVPGASAVLAAISLAGLPTDRFLFEGFLPPRQAARKSRIAEIASIPATLVLFESGARLADTLADLNSGLGERDTAICRELTKLHEEVRRGDLAGLAAHYATGGETRGEFVIVIAPPGEAEHMARGEDVDALLRRALGETSLKDAVTAVAEATGTPRRKVYQRALDIVKSHGPTD
jgi:16S rRNA (cytidine1402-2'-O)-methyltransferase